MTSTIESKPLENVAAALKTIVFVENESVDYLIARGQLAKLRVQNPIHRTTSVAAMLDYIRQAIRVRRVDPSAMPCVILMELRLPQRSGFDGLAALRDEPEFREIPVVAMGSADRVDSVKSAVQSGANGYLLKPFQAESFGAIVRELSLPLRFAEPSQKAAEPTRNVTPAKVEVAKPARPGLMSIAKGLGLF